MKKAWTPEERRNLLALKKKGVSDHGISRTLGRGVQSIRAALIELHAV
jgi:IS30 family transposase